MQFLRKTLVFLAAASLISLMFLATLTTVINKSFRPTPIKKLLTESKVYDTAVDSFLDQAKQSIKDDSGNSLNLADPALKEAAKQNITPEYLQSVSENFIDGTFSWLDGKTPKPNFVINVAEVKDKLANALGTYAKNRYATLPVCASSAEAAAAANDILNASCRPATGIDINAEADKIVAKLKENKEFLGDPTITADTLKTDKNGQSQPLFDQFKQVPKAYRVFRYTPFILFALLVISVLIVIFLSASRAAGLNRVGVMGLLVGVSLILGVVLTNYSYSHYVKQNIANLKNAETLKTTLSTSSALLVRNINHTTMTFGIIFTALGAAAITTSIILKKKSKKTSEDKPEDEGPEDKPKDEAEKKKPADSPKPKPAPTKVI